ncbi:MAG: VCBS repeat-containing protein [Deltaproteobacteria bacterium]|nr:VCBS repeat-containing protein [Deltaproteobacteria bacterium]
MTTNLDESPFPELPTDAFVSTQPVGGTATRMSSTPDGASSYSYPIWTPAGRHGLAPSLSLNYSSRGPNGVLGVGFSLSGVSSVDRCPRIMALDQQASGVGFEDGGRFCLDGVPLLPATADAEYGQVGLEYRPESAPTVRVRSVGGELGSPDHWIVQDGSGLSTTYGATSDSRVVGRRLAGPYNAYDSSTLGAESVVRWAVSRQEDPRGNAMEWAYEGSFDEDDELGAATEHYLATIHYTTHSTVPTFHEVAFEYSARPDIEDGFHAGVHLRVSRRLSAIRIRRVEGTARVPLRTYQISYRSDSITGRSLVSTIAEVDGLGVALPPTTLGWDTGTWDWEVVDTGHATAPAVEAYWPTVFVDLNGDGLDDVFTRRRLSPTNAFALFSNGTSFDSPVDFGTVINSYEADFDMDERGDLLIEAYFSGRWERHAYEWNGASLLDLTGDEIRYQIWNPARPSIFADFDGNRQGDQLDFYPDEESRPRSAVRFHGGASWNAWMTPDLITPPGFQPTPVDIDSDGRTELVELGATTTPNVFEFEDGTFRREPASFSLVSGEHVFADVNGDGAADLVYTQNLRAQVRVNFGNGTLGPARDMGPVAPHQDGTSAIRVADLNADGRDDLIILTETTPGALTEAPPQFLISNGRAFIEMRPSWSGGDRTPQYGFHGTRAGDVNGDGLVDFVMSGARPFGNLRLVRRQTTFPDHLVEVRDGLGARSRVQYTTAGDRQTYTPSTGCQYPQRCVNRGMTLVSRLEHDNGLSDQNGGNGWTSSRFFYADGRVDVLGRGFLGFAVFRRVQEQTGAEERSHFDLSARDGRYPFAGGPTDVYSGVVLETGRFVGSYSHTDYTYRPVPLPSDTTVFDVVTERVEVRSFLDTTAPVTLVALSSLPATTTTTTVLGHDAFGNMIDSVETVSGVSTTTVHRDMLPPTSAYHTGLVSYASVTDARWTGRSESIDRSYAYSPDGFLTEIVDLPASADEKFTTAFATSPVDGLVESITMSEEWEEDRVTRVYYDAARLYPRRVVNAELHETWMGIDPSFGIPLIAVDVNGVEGRRYYDGFGRPRGQSADDGSGTQTDYSATAGSPLITTTVATTGRYDRVTTDRLGRANCFSTRRLDGVVVEACDSYDALGRLSSTTRPDSTGAHPVNMVFEYDRVGRTLRATREDGAVERFEYAGLTTSHWDTGGRRVSATVLANGERRFETEVLADAFGARALTTSFIVGPFGRIASQTSPRGSVTSWFYSPAGRVVRFVDRDRGDNRYAYNGYGELRWSRDAAMVESEWTRDLLGRALTRTLTSGERFSWTWDTDATGVGRPSSSSHTTAVGTVLTTYRYDSFGRERERTFGISGESTTRTFVRDYDSVGRLRRMTYPRVAGVERFVVRYEYGPHGHLRRLVDTRTTSELWRATATDDWGVIVNERAGEVTHSRVVDQRTGLTSRHTATAAGTVVQDLAYERGLDDVLDRRVDMAYGRTETFGHDSLLRLVSWTLSVGGATRASAYTYGDDGDLLSATTPDGTSTYDYAPARVHRLTGFFDAESGTTTSYTYNPNGDVRGWSAPTFDVNIQHNAFHLFDRITLDRASGDDWTARYYYDASGQRVARRVDGVVDEVSLDGLYEKRGSQHHFYVRTPGSLVVRVTQQAGIPEERVVLTRDLQGSITGVVGAVSGELVQRYFYSPWGDPIARGGTNRRYPRTDATEDEGFTGHLHDRVPAQLAGLVHMQGRTYDSRTRRMLEPDPVLDGPTAQMRNPYAYAGDSPVAFVDPDGYRANPGDLVWNRTSSMMGGRQVWNGAHLDGSGRVATSGGEITLYIQNISKGYIPPGGGIDSAKSDGIIDAAAVAVRQAGGSPDRALWNVFANTPTGQAIAHPGFPVFLEGIATRVAVGIPVAAAVMAASQEPGVGEMLDTWTLNDPEADGIDKFFASVSLGISAWTLATSPNYGAARRALYAIDDIPTPSFTIAPGAMPGGTTSQPASAVRIARIHFESLPIHEQHDVNAVLRHVQNGTTPAHPVQAKHWNSPYGNKQYRLPGPSFAGNMKASPFREFRVMSPGETQAGLRRVVLNIHTGERYYSWTHYGDTGAPHFVRF